MPALVDLSPTSGGLLTQQYSVYPNCAEEAPGLAQSPQKVKKNIIMLDIHICRAHSGAIWLNMENLGFKIWWVGQSGSDTLVY